MCPLYGQRTEKAVLFDAKQNSQVQNSQVQSSFLASMIVSIYFTFNTKDLNRFISWGFCSYTVNLLKMGNTFYEFIKSQILNNVH